MPTNKTPPTAKTTAPGRGKERMPPPDQVALSATAGARLSALTGIDSERLTGRTVAQLRDDLDWIIDPSLFLFRKVCGRVVKHDSASGEDWGVPGATVHVYDTDFNLFGYFPNGWQFGWYWPFGWRREQIGQAVTDACGNFCVWIPRFEIDWILRWRRERICFGDIFVKPSLRDILDRLRDHVEIPHHIGPPDPGPLHFLKGGIGSAAVLEQAVGSAAAHRIQADLRQGIGSVSTIDSLLDRRAFTSPVPPPSFDHLSEQIKSHLPIDSATKTATSAKQSPVLDGIERAFTPSSWVGPFLRCFDVFVPEFVPVFDIPDVTFGVTQDVDGDGVEETIYGEGLFDVRWDSGPIPPVTLVADPMAFATPTCGDQPPLGSCAKPQLVVVGHMPLLNPTGVGTFPIIDTATGYAVRPNRPHTTGQTAQVPSATLMATSPAAGLLEFWGCAHHLADGTPADHYRINARVSTDGGATFGPSAPIIDTWNNWRTVGNPPILEQHPMSQLPGGWWEVLNPADNWIPGHQYLLQWHGAPNGLIELVLELGTLSGGTVTAIGSAAPVRLRVDNSIPHPEIVSMGWRAPGGVLHPLPLNCPTIARNHQDIEVVLNVQVTAGHLRSVELFGTGCGGGASSDPTLLTGFETLEGLAVATGDYWHKNSADNALSRQVVWSVPAALSPGAYEFGLRAYSRAFQPGDGHVYNTTNPDITYEPAPIWTYAKTAIAIVD